MQRNQALLAALLVSALAVAPLIAEEEPRAPRGRRANGSMYVPATDGSLPFGGEEYAPSAVPLERGHYLHDPEWMDRTRRESYVDADMPEGWLLGRPVGTSEQPIAARAPARQLTFDGLNRDTAGYRGQTGFPPDANVSVGPTKVIQATNIALRMTSREGAELDRLPLNDFFGFDSNNSLFDPKVYFDRLSQRFFLVALEQDPVEKRSGIWVAVSKGSDPEALSAPEHFCTYRIPANRAGSWADYPLIGINEKWFAVAVNNFRFSDGGFRRSYIYVMPVAQITANGEACPGLGIRRFDPHNDAAGIPAANIHPAQHYTSNALDGTPLFLVSSSAIVPSRDYTLWRITTDGGGQPRISKQRLTGDFDYHLQPLAPQKDGSELDTGDWRVTQVAFRDGKVWAVHGTACAIGPLPNEACVRAVEITPTTDSATLTYGETFGRPNTFLFWPGVAINKLGDVAMAFQKSKAGTFLGTVFNGKRAEAAHFDTMKNLRVGNCPLSNLDFNLGVNRTGDYVGLQTDPVDNLTFWVTGEYPGNIGIFSQCDWKTRIGKAKY